MNTNYKVKIIKVIFMILCITTIYILNKFIVKDESEILLGGVLSDINIECYKEVEENNNTNFEKYFRPSTDKVLNIKENINTLLDKTYDKSSDNIDIPKYFLISPEETLLSYFSILREAANPEKGKYTGCGSLGTGKIPYKIAYNFYSDEYKQKVTYKMFEESFKNILHINLIKLNRLNNIETEENDKIKYFYEIETIQGSESGVGYFAYCYGEIDIVKNGDEYLINNITITPEVYLCAPYHGWNYNGESIVTIKYGEWCGLVKEITNITVNDYKKDIYFRGTDNKEYRIQFYTLTNDYDIEVAQYVKDSFGLWQRIYMNPTKCLDKKK